MKFLNFPNTDRTYQKIEPRNLTQTNPNITIQLMKQKAQFGSFPNLSKETNSESELKRRLYKHNHTIDETKDTVWQLSKLIKTNSESEFKPKLIQTLTYN